ncbi:hypothetical protein [Acinetobacter lwoffii]|uniref:hypothetical protein n=2 Tax=Acinetobacter lwoffii TaxID=28090 RepID=UPI002097A215|nr:hypothetical protein [Acinetobacter lwoffii]MCO8081870.1 hypothetical protein [Acinetobacter lwoffii]
MNFPQLLLMAGWVALSAPAALAVEPPMSGKASSGAASSAADKKAIASAMTAAPKKVAAAATIVAVGADGKMRTLRKGNNGFTCMPDNPTTPGPDPMCMDQAALEWAEAWMGHKPPTVGKVGFMYMLAGGTDASNVDPYAKKPTTGNRWVKTGPHVMIVGAEARFYDMYPKHTQPDTAVPYVMWSGTPYQHLMIPVK